MKLLRRFAIIARYFLFDGSFSNNVKKHKAVVKTLAPFIADKLIPAKTALIYMRMYISTAIPLKKAVDVLNHHYTFLLSKFSSEELKHLFIDGVVCYQEDNYKVVLSGSEDREREGSLSLYFLDGDVNISQLSFTISSGETFGVDAENIAVISRIQQIYAHVEKVREAKKNLQDIMPTVILFTVLEAICVTFNIKHVLGIHGKHQLSYEAEFDRGYVANYDEFWMHNGGISTEYGFLMDCPFPQKDLLEIKQTHRNRAKRKRDKQDIIYNDTQSVITKMLA